VLLPLKSLFLHTLNQFFLIDFETIGGLPYAIVFSNVHGIEWSMAIHQLPRRRNHIAATKIGSSWLSMHSPWKLLSAN